MSHPDGPVPGSAGTPSPSVAFLVMALGRRLRDDVERELRAHGLALRHLSALGHLSREPGLSYSELGRRAGVTAQSMQATLRQLENRGAVERRTTPGRGRTARLHITDTGASLVAAGFATMDEVDRQLLAAIQADMREPVTRALFDAFVALRHPDGQPHEQ